MGTNAGKQKQQRPNYIASVGCDWLTRKQNVGLADTKGIQEAVVLTESTEVYAKNSKTYKM